jgi:hypothetical protein
MGSANFGAIPDGSISPGVPIGEYGHDLDCCGDVNGDGYSDLVVLVRYEEERVQKVEIHYGGEEMDSTPDWTISGKYYRVSGLEDVNGDKYSDLLVLPRFSIPEVYFGGNPMDTIPDLTFQDRNFRHVGGGVGDLNGDGYGDICLPMVLPDSTFARDCIYYGGPELDNIPDAFLLDFYGERCASRRGLCSGDFNGDGIPFLTPGCRTVGGIAGMASQWPRGT